MESTRRKPTAQELRVQLLFRQSVSSFLALLFVSPLFVYTLRDVCPRWQLSAWLVAVYLVSLLRLLHVSAFHRATNRGQLVSVRRWELTFGVGTWLSGILWGTAAYLFYPVGSVAHQAFVTFVIAGMASGAVGSYGPSFISAAGFLSGVLLPFAYRIYSASGEIHGLMAGLVLFYFAMFLSIARRLTYYVDEHVRMSEEQELLAEELRKVNVARLHASRLAAVGEMSAGVAHEINNPLAIIEGISARLVKLAEDGKLTPQAMREDLGRVRSTVERIARIVRGLMIFSSGHRAPVRSTASVERIVEHTLDLCRARMMAHQIELSVNRPPGALNLNCIAVQISQVLLNLLNNSFDAVSELPTRWIRIDITDGEEHIEFSVTDSGRRPTNIAPEEWFRPFFTTKDVGRGTGLGLSVSKGIVETHRGRIWVDSASENTRIVFTIPKSDALSEPGTDRDAA